MTPPPASGPEAKTVPRRHPALVTWAVVIGLHLAAFLAFHLATERRLESEVTARAADVARERLEVTTTQLLAVAQARTGDQPGGHLFDDILDAQTGIEYRLITPSGDIMGEAEDLSASSTVDYFDFVAGDEPQHIWPSTQEHRMEGLVRLTANETCLPCHVPGTTRGVIYLTVDYREILNRAQLRAKRNLGLLMILWLVAAAFSFLLIRRSARRWFTEMLADLERVDGTLRTLLSSARPSPPRLSTVDVRDLIQDVRRLMKPALDHTGVTLRTEVPTERLEVEVDAAQIRQVLIDLLQNAVEALEAKPDGGLVKLKAGWLPTGDGLILTVEDNGPGIAEADQDRIFQPFYSTRFSGTGLGLASARSIVEQLGGSLQVESTEGEGATFYVVLPASVKSTADVTTP